MNYKNINLSELGTKQKITYVASKVALFVPRLLGKLSAKLIVNPITKVVTGGSTYEEVKDAAVDLTMQMQQEEAFDMEEKILTGKQILEAWADDKEYYIGNIGKFKSYKSTLEDLMKTRAKLVESPKKLLVAKNYLTVMKVFRAKHQEYKANQEMIQKIVGEYQARQEALKNKELEINVLEDALRKAREDAVAMRKGNETFERTNASIIAQVREQMAQKEAIVEDATAAETNFVIPSPLIELGAEPMPTPLGANKFPPEEIAAILSEMGETAQQTAGDPNADLESYGLEPKTM